MSRHSLFAASNVAGKRRPSQSNLKEISPEYSFGKTVAEAEAPILRSHDAKS